MLRRILHIGEIWSKKTNKKNATGEAPMASDAVQILLRCIGADRRRRMPQ
jgi:hypothetical protein